MYKCYRPHNLKAYDRGRRKVGRQVRRIRDNDIKNLCAVTFRQAKQLVGNFVSKINSRASSMEREGSGNESGRSGRQLTNCRRGLCVNDLLLTGGVGGGTKEKAAEAFNVRIIGFLHILTPNCPAP